MSGSKYSEKDLYKNWRCVSTWAYKTTFYEFKDHLSKVRIYEFAGGFLIAIKNKVAKIRKIILS